jgi:hypothetical protein
MRVASVAWQGFDPSVGFHQSHVAAECRFLDRKDATDLCRLNGTALRNNGQDIQLAEFDAERTKHFIVSAGYDAIEHPDTRTDALVGNTLGDFLCVVTGLHCYAFVSTLGHCNSRVGSSRLLDVSCSCNLLGGQYPLEGISNFFELRFIRTVGGL